MRLAIYTIVVSLIAVIVAELAPDVAAALTIPFVALIVVPAVTDWRRHDRAT